MRSFSRVLAYPQVLKSQQATRVQRHQHFSPFHDVQSERPSTDNDPLRLQPKRQDHPVLVLRQEGEAETEGDEGEDEVKEWIWFRKEIR